MRNTVCSERKTFEDAQGGKEGNNDVLSLRT